VRRALPAVLAGLALAGCTGPATPAPSPSPPVPILRQSLPGSTARECVAVPDGARNVRSGDFVAGDFVEYHRQWRPDLGPGIGKIYWIPARPPANAALTITATSAAGRVETYDAGSLAYTDDGTPLYPSGVPLPTTGTWTLLARAGDQWGCFELTLP
jgi:hypothetical protein